MKNRNVSVLLLGILCFLSSFPAVSAEDAEQDIKSDCFEYLKNDVEESNMFGVLEFSEDFDFNYTPLDMSEMEYEEVAGNLSQKYKMQSMFGLDLKEPLFGLKMYSFGRETGYVHPPISPIATSVNSEKTSIWKEYTFFEEYLKMPDGEDQFLGCGVVQIDADDLMNVTREEYAFDDEWDSFIKDDEVYRSWYTSFAVYDHEGLNLGRFRKMIVYPQETINDYFDQYTVNMALPGREVQDFCEIDFGIYDPATGECTQAEMNIFEGEMPDLGEVEENVSQPSDRFDLYDYYQAIEDVFPEFNKKVAIGGLYEFDTIKEALVEPENEEYDEVWLRSLKPLALNRYYVNKIKGEVPKGAENEVFEEWLDEVGVGGQAIMEPEDLTQEKLIIEGQSEDDNNRLWWTGGILLIALILALLALKLGGKTYVILVLFLPMFTFVQSAYGLGCSLERSMERLRGARNCDPNTNHCPSYTKLIESVGCEYHSSDNTEGVYIRAWLGSWDYERSYNIGVREVRYEKKCDGRLANKDDYKQLALVGECYRDITRRKASVSFPTNSPFLYFSGMGDGEEITVSVDSVIAKPGLNNDSGWKFDARGEDEIELGGEVYDELYYEFENSEIKLNRNGINFASLDELNEFLYGGEFFNEMGFSEKEKQNSLSVIADQIPEAENYYLTILSDESVDELSDLQVSPEPDTVIKKFFAIYPSDVEVKTVGGLQYPEKVEEVGFTVKEFGEVVVKNGVQVFWE